MQDHQKMALARIPEGQETILVVGVVGIGVRDRQRIPEDRRRLREGNAVFRDVDRSLLRVSLELHEITVPRCDRLDKGISRVRRGPRNSSALASTEEQHPPDRLTDPTQLGPAGGRVGALGQQG